MGGSRFASIVPRPLPMSSFVISSSMQKRRGKAWEILVMCVDREGRGQCPMKNLEALPVRSMTGYCYE